MKCTVNWIMWQLALGAAELALTGLSAVILTLAYEVGCVQGVPWAETTLGLLIVVIYAVSSFSVAALAVQETVRWFVLMVGEMKS